MGFTFVNCLQILAIVIGVSECFAQMTKSKHEAQWICSTPPVFALIPFAFASVSVAIHSNKSRGQVPSIYHQPTC